MIVTTAFEARASRRSGPEPHTIHSQKILGKLPNRICRSYVDKNENHADNNSTVVLKLSAFTTTNGKGKPREGVWERALG